MKSLLSCSRETASTRIFRNDIVVCLREMESWLFTGHGRKSHDSYTSPEVYCRWFHVLLSRWIYLGCEKRLSAYSHLGNMNSIVNVESAMAAKQAVIFCGTHICTCICKTSKTQRLLGVERSQHAGVAAFHSSSAASSCRFGCKQQWNLFDQKPLLLQLVVMGRRRRPNRWLSKAFSLISGEIQVGVMICSDCVVYCWMYLEETANGSQLRNTSMKRPKL